MASTSDIAARELFPKLHPGDRVEAKHSVKVGQKTWTATTVGTVVKSERRRHGLHFRRNVDDKVYSDMLVLKGDDGSLTTVTMDEYTVLKRLN